MVKSLDLYALSNLSYSPLSSYNWMCVEDPFSQIRSHIMLVLELKQILLMFWYPDSKFLLEYSLKSHDPVHMMYLLQ